MITPGFELEPTEGFFVDPAGLATECRYPNGIASSTWSDKTPDEILADVNADLALMSGPPLEGVPRRPYPMEGVLVSGWAWAGLLKCQRRSMVRLFLHSRRGRRPKRFSAKEVR